MPTHKKKNESSLLVTDILSELATLEELQRKKRCILSNLNPDFSGCPSKILTRPRTILNEGPSQNAISGHHSGDPKKAVRIADDSGGLSGKQFCPCDVTVGATRYHGVDGQDHKEVEFFFWARKLASHFEQVISRLLLHDPSVVGKRADSLYQDYIMSKRVEGECAKMLSLNRWKAEHYPADAASLSRRSTAELLQTDSESEEFLAETEYGTDEDDPLGDQTVSDPVNLQSVIDLLTELRSKADEETSFLFKLIYSVYFQG